MDFDFTCLPSQDRYRLLTNFVGPRPIPLVTTRPEGGHGIATGSSADLAFVEGATLAEAVAAGGPVALTVKGDRITGRAGQPVKETP